MNEKTLKILGFTATLIGIAAQVLAGWTDEKKLENRINESVNKKFEEMSKENDISNGEES